MITANFRVSKILGFLQFTNYSIVGGDVSLNKDKSLVEAITISWMLPLKYKDPGPPPPVHFPGKALIIFFYKFTKIEKICGISAQTDVLFVLTFHFANSFVTCQYFN